MINLTDETFDDFIRDNSRVLVDFWANWCGPCKSFELLLEEIEREMAGITRFAKVDVGDDPGLADRFGITGLPTVILFQDGNETFKESGVLPKQKIIAALR
jgi:thioredoxin 1